MKDQELHDIFHAYRPEMGDEEDFMARLNEQMDAIDAKQQQPRIIPFYRKVFPWAAGIAAVIAVAFLFDKGRQESATTAQIQNQRSEYYEYYYYNRYSASSDSYEEIVNEIEQSGRQLENAIAQL